MPRFLLSCRPFCLVCCRIVRSKEGLVLSSCDPVDSSSSLSLQRSSLVIEIASNHYPEYAAPSDKIPSLRPVSPTRAARTPPQIPLLYRMLWPFPHVESSQSVCHLRGSDERVKTLLTPQRCPICWYSHCFPGHQQRRIDDELACKARDRTVG